MAHIAFHYPRLYKLRHDHAHDSLQHAGVVRQDFIRTARAKGATEKRVVFRHALKNAIIPVITVVGTAFGSSLGGAVVTETVFGLPGMGTQIITAIRQKDNPVVLASVIVIALAFSLVNLIVDILYTYVDPRIRD